MLAIETPQPPSSSLNPRRLRHCLRSLRRVIYFLYSADSSVVVAESSGSSSSADAAVAVVNYMGQLTHRRLLCQIHSLGRVVSSASSANATVVVLESLGSSSSANASNFFVNSLKLMLRCCSLRRRSQTLRRVVPYTSFFDAYGVVVKSLVSYSSANTPVVVVDSAGQSA